ncbi:MAG: glutathione synthase, partial [Thermodesulfobacteriota bacterium]
IPTDGRSLRVVVIGQSYYSYWRVASEDQFYTNLARGATIDHELFPHLQDKAVQEVKAFCGKSGVNLAGFDFLFSTTEEAPPPPLFLEINYCFRTKGLGGPDRYLDLLTAGIRKWLAGLPSPS